MRTLFWIAQMGPKSNDMCLCKSEAEADLTYRCGGSNVTKEAEIVMMWLQIQGVNSHQKRHRASRHPDFGILPPGL